MHASHQPGHAPVNCCRNKRTYPMLACSHAPAYSRAQVWMYSPLFSFDLDVLETRVPGWARMAAKLDRELKGLPHK